MTEYSHFDNTAPCGGSGLAVGATGSEIPVADSSGNLYQAGVAVTSTATELNALDGITATVAELNLIDGSVAGTAVASKAAVLGADKNLDVLAIADLKLGAGAGTSVTPTAAKINLLTQGVEADYKIARGTHTPITASDTVVTGLATVVSAVASLRGDPSLTHMFSGADKGDQVAAPAAGEIYIKSQKPTSAADVTPIAATTPWVAVDWIAIGT